VTQNHDLIAILPCNDLDRSEAFYARLGFERHGWDDEYRILSDGKGAKIHLIKAVEGWLVPGRNPFGLYLHTDKVDELAKSFGKEPRQTEWGMYEFTLSDPDETFVRIGCPSVSER